MISIERVRPLLIEVCPHDADEITEDKRLVADLDLDSFGMMDLITAFEDEFNIQIPDSDLKLFDTVADVIAYLNKKTGGDT